MLGSWWNYLVAGDCFSFSPVTVISGSRRLVVCSSWRERQPWFKATLFADPRCNSLVCYCNIGAVFLCTAQITRYSSSMLCGLDGSSCVWRVERTQSHMGSCRHRSVLGYVEGEAAFLVLVLSRSFLSFSLTQAHHPKQPLRFAGRALTINLRSKSNLLSLLLRCRRLMMTDRVKVIAWKWSREIFRLLSTRLLILTRVRGLVVGYPRGGFSSQPWNAGSCTSGWRMPA